MSKDISILMLFVRKITSFLRKSQKGYDKCTIWNEKNEENCKIFIIKK